MRVTREKYTRGNIKLKLHSLNRNEEYTTHDTDQQLIEQEYRDRTELKSRTESPVMLDGDKMIW
jgi:hypothetical protein